MMTAQRSEAALEEKAGEAAADNWRATPRPSRADRSTTSTASAHTHAIEDGWL